MSNSQDSAPLRSPKGFRVPALSVFQIRDYRLIWGSTTLSNICMFMDMVVLALLVLQRTDSPMWVALVGAFRLLPWLVFGVFSGLVADRADRWHVMVLARSSNVLVMAILLVLVITDWVQPWHMLLTALVLGLAVVLDIPSRQSFIQDLVGPQNLVRAMSLDTITFTIGSILGSLLAGILVELTGFTGAFIFLLSVYFLSLVVISQVKSRTAKHSTTSHPLWQNLVSGISYSLHNRTIRGVLAITLIMNFMALGAFQLFPVVARDHLNVGPGLTGVLISANGIGTFIGATTIVYMGITTYHGRIFGVGTSLLLVGLLLFALSPWYLLSFLMLLMVGVGVSGFATMQFTLILMSSATERRGAALGVLGLCIGVSPIGTLMMGVMATLLNAQAAIGIGAVAGLLLMLPVMVFSALMGRSTSMVTEGAVPPGDIATTGRISQPP